MVNPVPLAYWMLLGIKRTSDSFSPLKIKNLTYNAGFRAPSVLQRPLQLTFGVNLVLGTDFYLIAFYGTKAILTSGQNWTKYGLNMDSTFILA